MTRVREWLAWHSVRAHLVAPIWTRVPEKARWRIVTRLNRSKRQCWTELVGVAMTHREKDACDTYTPSLRGDKATRCATVCDWSHPDHAGEHDCSCYCGKFQFLAADGAIDRKQVRDA